MERSPANSSVPVIEMRGVVAGALRDQARVVADDINWTVGTGDYWAVAGLHGSGKSDFLAMTAGLMAPLAGSYRFLGEEMPIFEEARLAQRLRLGLVFDDGHLFSQLTVWENVALPLCYHRKLSASEAQPRAQRILEALELEPWAGLTPGAIGHNWQKRVGLARALALGPEVLLVDNALSGLDLRQVNWWLDFLDQLSQGHSLLEGRPATLVVTTADLRPWKGRARQFAVLRDRRLVVLGAWPKLEAASDELLQEFLAESQRREREA